MRSGPAANSRHRWSTSIRAVSATGPGATSGDLESLRQYRDWGRFLFAILGSIGLGFVVRGTPWILGSAAMLVAALVIGGVASRARAPVRLIHLDGKTATLRGVHPNVARALREF